MKNIQLINDHFQNFKSYGIPKAQLIIADPPYNLGVNAYASNPSWYVDGDNKKGESDKAGRAFFDTDNENMKLTQIAKYVRRDHSSMLHLLRKYDDDFKYNPQFRDMATRVNNILNKTNETA
jgi:hypothetical protein|nr:MAG TPA: chromosomal replication initiator protein [Caudoviricetes sp.]